MIQNCRSQTKIIPEQELQIGSGIFFSATMDLVLSEISITMKGPDDRWFGTGIGAFMWDADVLIYTDGKIGAMHPLGVMDYYLNSNSASGVNLDATQDWTINSNTTNAGVRTIQATRALNTGDSQDIALDFSDVSLNVIWAKFYTTGFTLDYHGGPNRGTLVMDWQLVDVTPPLLGANPFTPLDEQINVTLGTNFSVYFDESIQAGTGNIELKLLSNNSIVESFDVTSDVTINGAQLLINPTINLSSFTDYYITIPSGTIEDLAGNLYLGFTDNATWNFTTLDNSSDVIPPTLSIDPFLPNDNSSGVDLNTNLIITFDEDIMAGTGLLELRLSSSGTLVESFDVQTDVSISSMTATMTPSSPLSYQTDYYVVVPGMTIVDLIGNPYAGFTDNTTWNFTTIDNLGLNDISDKFIITLNDNSNIYIGSLMGIDYTVRLISITGQELWSASKTSENTIINTSKIVEKTVIVQIHSDSGNINKLLHL